MLPKAIAEYLAAHRDEHLEQLFEVIRFASISSQGEHDADCAACAEHLVGCLRKLGFDAGARPWRKHPVVLGRRDAGRADAPTVLIYGHYDVQPPEPLELWKTPPFEPTVRDGAVYARGASDDKGQLFAHVKAAEALLATTGQLPLNVIYLFEGEEEIGSPGLEEVVAEHAGELKADFAVISDSGFFAAGLPSITYGLRGLTYAEVTVKGPSSDLHSGTHGGAVVNPLNALAELIGAMRDPATGRATLPGFYDDVAALTEAERRAWEALPFDESAYAADVGADPAGGERAYSVLERRWARPTLDCHGLVGGYQGEGAKTVIPSSATAKLSMRLVAHQRPEKVAAALKEFVAGRAPAGTRATVEVLTEARPVLMATDSPAVKAVRSALTDAFGAEVAMIRNGASVPIAELIQRVLKIEPIVAGLGLPDDNLHAPNEKFSLEQFDRGRAAAAGMLNRLGALGV